VTALTSVSTEQTVKSHQCINHEDPAFLRLNQCSQGTKWWEVQKMGNLATLPDKTWSVIDVVTWLRNTAVAEKRKILPDECVQCVQHSRLMVNKCY